MKAVRTEQIYIEENDTLSNMCHISKNLYNQVNYILKNQFVNKEKMSGYSALVKLFQEPTTVDEHNNYQKLPTQTAQWTIKKAKQDWNSHFKLIKAWKKQPDNFSGKPRPPQYKNRNGEFMLIFTNQQCKIDNGVLKFPKIMEMEVKTGLENVDLREVRILPSGVGYMIEIVYQKDVVDRTAKFERVIGIDIVVRAGLLKSKNQFYNKELAGLRSINDIQKNVKQTKRMQQLSIIRNGKVKDIMHRVSKSIVDYAIDRSIDTIVIKHNNGWKQSINNEKINNQNFVQLPFDMLIQQIKYKAEEKGINVVIQEESHTSKCSFLDNESVEHHDTYIGKRISRGVFLSANSTRINAYLNASYNIIKKALPEEFVDGIEGVGLHPTKFKHQADDNFQRRMLTWLT